MSSTAIPSQIAAETPPGGPSPVRPSDPRKRGLGRLDLTTKARIILVGWFLVFLVVWQLAAQLGWIDRIFVSSPVDVILAGGDLFTQAIVWNALAETGRSILIAFVLGTTSGVIAGFIFGLSKTIREAYYGFVLFIMSTPKSIFLPIFLLIFGIGPTSAAAFATFETFFYVCVNVVGGVALVESRHLRLVRAFRGGWWHRLVDVIFPAASPGIFTGIWFGVKHAFLGVVIMELFVSLAGLGYLIHLYTNNLDTDNVLLLVITVIVATILAGTLWNKVEARLTRWRPASSARGANTALR